jgi:chromosome segregation ATPase
MSKESDAAIAIGAGVLIGAGLTALIVVPRIRQLEAENAAQATQIDALNIQVEDQHGQIISLRGYIDEQARQLSSLETDFTDLDSKYDKLISELEYYQGQISHPEAQQALLELINRAKQRKTQRTPIIRAFY